MKHYLLTFCWSSEQLCSTSRNFSMLLLLSFWAFTSSSSSAKFFFSKASKELCQKTKTQFGWKSSPDKSRYTDEVNWRTERWQIYWGSSPKVIHLMWNKHDVQTNAICIKHSQLKLKKVAIQFLIWVNK